MSSSRSRWVDLITDHKTGKLRETALWSNIGKATMTWGFIYQVLQGLGTEWLWVAYGSIVVVHEATARFFNQKQTELDKNVQPRSLKPKDVD